MTETPDSPPVEGGTTSGAIIATVAFVTRRLAHALLVVAVAATSLLVGVIPAEAAWTHRHALRSGTIGDGQTADALAVRDNQGTSDNWPGYIEFIPDATRHRSVITLRPGGPTDGTMTVSWNYRGPEFDEMLWRIRIKNQDTGKWETIFKNKNLTAWEWTQDSIEIADSAAYLMSNGRIRFRFESKTALDVGQLDELNVSFDGGSEPTEFPSNQPFDYQIGEPYTPAAETQVVARDWFDADPAPGLYNICYVNAFQTQPDDGSVDRPDELSNWPANLVLTDLGDDPNWGGEYLIDISTNAKRTAALAWLRPMVETCATKGYDAVEYDNLDSWTRFDGTPLEGDVPFGRGDAIAFATGLSDLAHEFDMLSAQKNTSDLTAGEVASIGFDFAVVEECGRYDECDVFAAVYGDDFVVIEYRDQDFAEACSVVGADVSVVRRDRNVRPPTANAYRYDEC